MANGDLPTIVGERKPVAAPPRPTAPPPVQVPEPAPPPPPGRDLAPQPTTAPVATFDSTGTIRIGRDDGNDIVLSDIWVSGKHAEIRRRDGQYLVVDLGSANGLLHNGLRVSRAPLLPGDRFTIGRHEFLFNGDHIYVHDDHGPTSLVCDQVTVMVDGRVPIDDISFALPQGSLLGIIGPSGSGKSTLARVLGGSTWPSQGRVLYDGRDLYGNYAELGNRIGFVPQTSTLHADLTVRAALRFSAQLRFASDVPRRELYRRVAEVLDQLGLSTWARTRIDRLSYGQRSRAGVALALLTEPALLALDEPTSGLDPSLDKEVMRELRELADRGRTVVVTTNSVLHLHLCDRVLVLCLGGRMGYFGPPDELLDFFQAEDYADVFDKVTNDTEAWPRIYVGSDTFRRYVLNPAVEMARSASELPPTPADEPTPRPDDGPDPVEVQSTEPGGTEPGGTERGAAVLGVTVPAPAGARRPSLVKPRRWAQQWATLTRRQAWVTAQWRPASLMLALPLLLGALSYVVPHGSGLGAAAPGDARLEARLILTLLTLGAALIGCATSIREVVGELSGYRYERALSITPGQYLAAKVTVLAPVYLVQVGLLYGVTMLGRVPPGRTGVVGVAALELLGVLYLVALASGLTGLALSALLRTPEQATPVLLVYLLAQAVTSGALFGVAGTAVGLAAWLFPARWGLAATAATTRLFDDNADTLWHADSSAWWRCVAILGGQVLLALILARLALRHVDRRG